MTWPAWWGERVHDRVMDQELRKAHREAAEDMIRHGRFMFLLGLAVGFALAAIVL